MLDTNYENQIVQEYRPKPWGVWATIGFSCIIAVAYIAVVVFAIIAIIIIRSPGPGFPSDDFAEKLQTDGLFLSIIICANAPIVVGLCVLFAAIRKGISISEYLGLRMVRCRTVLLWLFVTIGMGVLSDALARHLEVPVTPDFMVAVYSTAGFLPLLWLALTWAAPIYEEVFFRGFLFKGLQHSRLGSVGAVIITALVWAAIHTQYEAYAIFHIFVLGLLFGWARTKTGSVLLTILMHSIVNIIATVQVALYMESI